MIRPMEDADLARLIAARADLPNLLCTVAAETVTPAQISALVFGGPMATRLRRAWRKGFCRPMVCSSTLQDLIRQLGHDRLGFSVPEQQQMLGEYLPYVLKVRLPVAASTVEAEYMSASNAMKEALWFRKLGGDLELDLGTVQIYCDNQGAIRLLKHPIASQRSKHIDVIHHFARERVARKEVELAYCKTEDIKADILTKALAPESF